MKSKILKSVSEIILSEKLGFNNDMVDHLNNLKYYESLSKAELDNIIVVKFSLLIEHLKSNDGYYSKYASLINLDNNIYDELKKFPILTKKELIKYKEDLIYTKNKKLIEFSSSGSSGIRSVCYLSEQEISQDRATQIRWWQWGGVVFGDPIIQTGMGGKERSILKKIKDDVFNTKYLQAFKLNHQEVTDLVVNSKNNTSLCGYASSLYNLAEICEDLEFDKNNIKTAISWGDKLFPHYRRKIKEVFDIDIYETYGCAEGIKMAAQYDLDYMYIMSPNVIIEIVDDFGNIVPDGVMGNILITSLDRFSMPMIRYKIGDLGIKLPRDKYPKNRLLNYDIFEKIIGRDTDLIKLPNGEKLTVHSFTGIIEYIKEIKQFRVIQTDNNKILIEYIKSDDCFDISEIVNKLKKELECLISINGFVVDINEVSHIPSTPSGKPQIIKSLII